MNISMNHRFSWTPDVRSVNPMTNFIDAEHMARTFVDHGITSVPQHHIAALAADAVHHGASPVLAAVLADPNEPPVARLRAFSRVAGVFTSPAQRPLATAA